MSQAPIDTTTAKSPNTLDDIKRKLDHERGDGDRRDDDVGGDDEGGSNNGNKAGSRSDDSTNGEISSGENKFSIRMIEMSENYPVCSVLDAG